MPAARRPQEIRASVEATRQELEFSINDLQSKVRELTNWRSQLNQHRRDCGRRGFPVVLGEREQVGERNLSVSVQVAQFVHGASRLAVTLRQNQEVGKIDRAVVIDVTHGRGRLSFVRADVHSAARNSRQSALIGGRAAGVPFVYSRTAGVWRLGIGGPAVVLQQAEHWINR